MIGDYARTDCAGRCGRALRSKENSAGPTMASVCSTARISGQYVSTSVTSVMLRFQPFRPPNNDPRLGLVAPSREEIKLMSRKLSENNLDSIDPLGPTPSDPLGLPPDKPSQRNPFGASVSTTSCSCADRLRRVGVTHLSWLAQVASTRKCGTPEQVEVSG